MLFYLMFYFIYHSFSSERRDTLSFTGLLLFLVFGVEPAPAVLSSFFSGSASWFLTFFWLFTLNNMLITSSLVSVSFSISLFASMFRASLFSVSICFAF